MRPTGEYRDASLKALQLQVRGSTWLSYTPALHLATGLEPAGGQLRVCRNVRCPNPTPQGRGLKTEHDRQSASSITRDSARGFS